MKEITPSVDIHSGNEVTVGDSVRILWVLNAQADKSDVVINVIEGDGSENEYSGSDLTVEEIEVDGERKWKYYVETTIPDDYTRIEYELTDPVNSIFDTARIHAHNRLT